MYVKEKIEVHVVVESKVIPHTKWKLNVQMKLLPQASGVWKAAANEGSHILMDNIFL